MCSQWCSSLGTGLEATSESTSEAKFSFDTGIAKNAAVGTTNLAKEVVNPVVKAVAKQSFFRVLSPLKTIVPWMRKVCGEVLRNYSGFISLEIKKCRDFWKQICDGRVWPLYPGVDAENVSSNGCLFILIFHVFIMYYGHQRTHFSYRWSRDQIL